MCLSGLEPEETTEHMYSVTPRFAIEEDYCFGLVIFHHQSYQIHLSLEGVVVLFFLKFDIVVGEL